MYADRKSTKFKEALLEKLNQCGISTAAFAKQEGIHPSTLYSWRKEFNTLGSFNVNKEIQPDKWSNEEKFSVVLETSVLPEVELGEYCRAKGLYPDQVKKWKQACITGNKEQPVKQVKENAEQKSDKKRIKILERELRRKDKALAEAAALLVLGKKFDAYWEEKEDS